MLLRNNRQERRGTVIVLVAFCTILIFGMLALAIDIGMIAIARSQCQNAADSAATAGARTITGDSTNNYNLDAVPAKAITAAIANKVLGQTITGSTSSYTTTSGYIFSSDQVQIKTGTYAYVYDDTTPANEGFKIQFPRTDTTEPYSAVRATITGSGNYAFGRVFGMSTFNTSATATSAHRPRDVIIIMDLSGSMRFQSLPGIYVGDDNVAAPSSSSRPRNKSMNGETVYPRFGHYSSASAALRGTTTYSTGSENVDEANISASSNSGPAIAEDWYQNASGVAQAAGNRAWTRAADTLETTPGGLNYLYTVNNTTTTYAKTCNEIFNSVTDKDIRWENSGYDVYTTFQDYTQGPGYWGKTFFIWPPDPRAATSPGANSTAYNNNAKDWRQRFFVKYRSSTAYPLDHNNILFNPSGSPASSSDYTPTPIMKLPQSDSTAVTESGTNNSYTYRINYEAILHWLRNVDPKPFPTILRAGKIKYYDDIPDPSSATYSGLNNRWWTTADSSLTNLNERFWKGYIDFVLGLQGTGAGSYSNTNVGPDGNAISDVPLSALIGNGDYFAWGTVLNSQKPNVTAFQAGNVNNSAGYAVGAGFSSNIAVKNLPSDPDVAVNYYVKFGGHTSLYRVTNVTTSSGTVTGIKITNGNGTGLNAAIANNETMTFYGSLPKYMDYNDNVYRPKHQFWFGPMTMIDYLGNYNTQRFWWPGNVHEAQCWACKIGIQTAIDDIKKNHPSDFIGMTFFSSPRGTYTSNGTTYTLAGQHNRAIVPLGRNYDQLKNSLWFPPTTVTGGVTEITPYDADFDNVPRAKGSTSPQMGFMIAYNLLSSSVTNLRTYSQPSTTYRGTAGGLGRKGATRLVIFETDGAPNYSSKAAIQSSGSDSYYKVRLKYPATISDSSNELPSATDSYSDSDVYGVVTQICALTTASPPGYATARKPVYIYPIGYGSLFDPNNTSTAQSNALDFMQNVANRGNTATDTTGSNFPDWQRIYGTNAQRITRMQTAFTKIMQNGIQITLLE